MDGGFSWIKQQEKKKKKYDKTSVFIPALRALTFSDFSENKIEFFSLFIFNRSQREKA